MEFYPEGMNAELDRQFTTPEALRRAMIENAGRSVFLCDSSKIGRRSAFNLMHLEELTCAVVGQALPKAIHTGECQLIIPDSNSPKAN